MKKLLIVLAVVLLGTMGAVPLSFALISGSAHDFSAEAWNPSNQICLPCHTPHNADTSVTDAPLWNHEVTTATFTLYSSATLDATLGQPDGRSKLCLSCHDGTTAVDAFGGAAGTNYMGTINPNAEIGTDLTDDHPISFVYDAALATADGKLFNPTTQASGMGSTIQNDMLFNDRIECSSCHDVHNQYNNSYLLNINNTASALCLTCHDL